jgi:hypothetical protein
MADLYPAKPETKDLSEVLQPVLQFVIAWPQIRNTLKLSQSFPENIEKLRLLMAEAVPSPAAEDEEPVRSPRRGIRSEVVAVVERIL